MKILKSRIFAFVLGAVLFSSITGVTAYTILASDVGFTPKNNSWKVDNLSDAIDDLYSKSKPAYTGTTTVTPTKSTQTLSTKDKILKDNITIDPIPSSYKNLTTTTDVNPSNLLNGIKAYNSNGELVTGNISTNCVSGVINTSNGYNTNTNKLVTSITPTKFLVYSISSDWMGGHFWYSSYGNKFIDFNYDANDNLQYVDTSQNLSKYYALNNGFYIHNYPSNITLYYMACK